MFAQNVFIKYLSKKYPPVKPKTEGPFITISREYGCFALDLAEKVRTKLDAGYPGDEEQPQWSILSKEIMDRSAEELRTNPEKISHIFDGKKKSILDDWMESMNKDYYLPDRRIIDTIKRLMRSYAQEGNIIIVGRAGAVITKDIENSLHIKLIAPFDFRVEKIKRKFHLSDFKAVEQVKMIDRKRNSFLEFFTKGKNELEFYDFVINCCKYKEDHLAELIVKLAEDKNIIKKEIVF